MTDRVNGGVSSLQGPKRQTEGPAVDESPVKKFSAAGRAYSRLHKDDVRFVNALATFAQNKTEEACIHTALADLIEAVRTTGVVRYDIQAGDPESKVGVTLGGVIRENADFAIAVLEVLSQLTKADPALVSKCLGPMLKYLPTETIEKASPEIQKMVAVQKKLQARVIHPPSSRFAEEPPPAPAAPAPSPSAPSIPATGRAEPPGRAK